VREFAPSAPLVLEFEDAVWEYSSGTRRLRRRRPRQLSDTFEWAADGPTASSPGGAGRRHDLRLDLGSRFRVWFFREIEDYSYRLLGERSMLASVEAANSPAQAVRD